METISGSHVPWRMGAAYKSKNYILRVNFISNIYINLYIVVHVWHVVVV